MKLVSESKLLRLPATHPHILAGEEVMDLRLLGAYLQLHHEVGVTVLDNTNILFRGWKVVGWYRIATKLGCGRTEQEITYQTAFQH